MRSPFFSSPQEQTRQIMHLLARGEAQSRTDLARILHLAPSTISLRVKELTAAGILREDGEGSSKGGRRPKLLRISPSRGIALACEFGAKHARIGVFALSGELQFARTIPVTVATGPINTLTRIVTELNKLRGDANVRAVGIALPAPVNQSTGSVEQPSRMPGWAGFKVGEYLADAFNAPVVVDNDATLMALGEHYRQLTRNHHSITVKAGTAIGSGIIVSGEVYRGASDAAGDITHTRIAQNIKIPCSCGNYGCLETVASGAGLVRQLQERGFNLAATAEALALSQNGDPVVTMLIREAGAHLGQVLSDIVNFFNPHAVFLTGSMSISTPFLAAVRSRIYEACHPLVTQALTIVPASLGHNAALYGAGQIALDQVNLTK